jgi:hypothetical protein
MDNPERNDLLGTRFLTSSRGTLKAINGVPSICLPQGLYLSHLEKVPNNQNTTSRVEIFNEGRMYAGRYAYTEISNQRCNPSVFKLRYLCTYTVICVFFKIITARVKL